MGKRLNSKKVRRCRKRQTVRKSLGRRRIRRKRTRYSKERLRKRIKYRRGGGKKAKSNKSTVLSNNSGPFWRKKIPVECSSCGNSMDYAHTYSTHPCNTAMCNNHLRRNSFNSAAVINQPIPDNTIPTSQDASPAQRTQEIPVEMARPTLTRQTNTIPLAMLNKNYNNNNKTV